MTDTDQIVTDTPAKPAAEVLNNPLYSPLVALKRGGWLGVKLGAANAAMPHVIAVMTKLYGSAPAPDSFVFHALPYVIIISLDLYHDWQKLQVKFPWL